MLVRPTIYELARSRRAVVLTPLVIVLNAVLIWTLAHTDIAAFATVFIAGVVLVFGTFWVTGPVSSRRIANLSHSAGRSFRLWR
jgi:multisubunit Na+/H+ antiporter MnhG subunit